MEMSQDQLQKLVLKYGDIETWLASDEWLAMQEIDNSIDLGVLPTPEEFLADRGYSQPEQND